MSLCAEVPNGVQAPTPAERERWESPGGILEWVPWGMAPWQMEPKGPNWRPRIAGWDAAQGLAEGSAQAGPAAPPPPAPKPNRRAAFFLPDLPRGGAQARPPVPASEQY